MLTKTWAFLLLLTCFVTLGGCGKNPTRAPGQLPLDLSQNPNLDNPPGTRQCRVQNPATAEVAVPGLGPLAFFENGSGRMLLADDRQLFSFNELNRSWAAVAGFAEKTVLALAADDAGTASYVLLGKANEVRTEILKLSADSNQQTLLAAPQTRRWEKLFAVGTELWLAAHDNHLATTADQRTWQESVVDQCLGTVVAAGQNLKQQGSKPFVVCVEDERVAVLQKGEAGWTETYELKVMNAIAALSTNGRGGYDLVVTSRNAPQRWLSNEDSGAQWMDVPFFANPAADSCLKNSDIVAGPFATSASTMQALLVRDRMPSGANSVLKLCVGQASGPWLLRYVFGESKPRHIAFDKQANLHVVVERIKNESASGSVFVTTTDLVFTNTQLANQTTPLACSPDSQLLLAEHYEKLFNAVNRLDAFRKECPAAAPFVNQFLSAAGLLGQREQTAEGSFSLAWDRDSRELTGSQMELGLLWDGMFYKIDENAMNLSLLRTTGMQKREARLVMQKAGAVTLEVVAGEYVELKVAVDNVSAVGWTAIVGCQGRMGERVFEFRDGVLRKR